MKKILMKKSFDVNDANQLFLAGLGAFAKAQQEGNKAFDALVRQGLAFQNQTQNFAKEIANKQWEKATEQMESLTSSAANGAGKWNTLEGIFENRVQKAMNQIGWPDANLLLSQISKMQEKIDLLEGKIKNLEEINNKSEKPVKSNMPAKKAVAKNIASK